jgi:hypothetical protein
MKRFALSLPCLLGMLLIQVLLSSCSSPSSGSGLNELSTTGAVGKFTDTWQTVPLEPLVKARVSMPGVPSSMMADDDVNYIALGGGGEMYAVMAMRDEDTALPVQKLENELLPMMAKKLSGGALQLSKVSERQIVVQGRKGKEVIMARQYSPRMRMVFHMRMVMRNEHEAVLMVVSAFEVPAMKPVIRRFMESLKFMD